jgi:Rod binding domain-containing protein
MSSSAIPPINQALLPADIRNGNAAAKNAYQEALGFEQIFMSQLAQQLVKGLDSSANAGSDGSTGGSTDGSASSSATDAYSQLLPSALTSSIMSDGGLGVAPQLAAAIDPAITSKK